MMYENYEKLYVQFISSLSGSVPGGTNPVKSLAENLALSRKFLAELRQLVLDVPFSSQEAEIHFFKHIKPKFYAEKIFAFEVYNVEMNKPVGTIDMIRSFLEDELRLIHRFFQQYAFMYQYYRSGAIELDSLYFLHGADIPLAMVPEMPDPDPGFSTAMDYLFAKFIAFEKLQDYLVEALRTPLPFMHESPVKRKSRRELRWTGDAINAVELGFSLHDTGQLNDGKASVVEIFEWMEEHLHVSIKKPHRRFDEIESRKIISKTDFTDRLRDAILNRIDRKNEYDPDKEEARRLRAEKRKKLSERKVAEKKAANDVENKDG